MHLLDRVGCRVYGRIRKIWLRKPRHVESAAIDQFDEPLREQTLETLGSQAHLGCGEVRSGGLHFVPAQERARGRDTWKAERSRRQLCDAKTTSGDPQNISHSNLWGTADTCLHVTEADRS